MMIRALFIFPWLFYFFSKHPSFGAELLCACLLYKTRNAFFLCFYIRPDLSYFILKFTVIAAGTLSWTLGQMKWGNTFPCCYKTSSKFHFRGYFEICKITLLILLLRNIILRRAINAGSKYPFSHIY